MYPKTALFNQLKEIVRAKTDTDFQRFITALFLDVYGATGFIPLREEKDRGCDGIIVSEKCIVACYGPKKYETRSFAKKVQSDFKKYQDNWESRYPHWRLVFNGEIAPDQIDIINCLKSDSIPFGIEQILSLIHTRLPHIVITKNNVT